MYGWMSPQRAAVQCRNWTTIDRLRKPERQTPVLRPSLGLRGLRSRSGRGCERGRRDIHYIVMRRYRKNTFRPSLYGAKWPKPALSEHPQPGRRAPIWLGRGKRSLRPRFHGLASDREQRRGPFRTLLPNGANGAATCREAPSEGRKSYLRRWRARLKAAGLATLLGAECSAPSPEVQ